MDETQKEQLADQLFRDQPHVVASLLVQKQLGVSLEKMDFLVDILLICFQAMKESGMTWPLITEEEQERQMGRFVATVHFGDDLPGSFRDRALKQYIEAHPESELLAFVNVETADWLQRVVPDESDKYVVMAAFNFGELHCPCSHAGTNNAHSKRTLNGKVTMCLFPDRACTGSDGDP